MLCGQGPATIDYATRKSRIFFDAFRYLPGRRWSGQLMRSESREMLEVRVDADHFVQNDAVIAEITEGDVMKTVNALDFLRG